MSSFRDILKPMAKAVCLWVSGIEILHVVVSWEGQFLKNSMVIFAFFSLSVLTDINVKSFFFFLMFMGISCNWCPYYPIVGISKSN